MDADALAVQKALLSALVTQDLMILADNIII